MTVRSTTKGRGRLQDRFDSRRLADRLEQVTLRRAFTDEDRAFIARAPMFFLATADARDVRIVRIKAGMPGFVQVVDDVTLAFPSYDGNGQFRSLGNLTVNPHVGMLFIDFEATKRIRVNGVASIDRRRCAAAPHIPDADIVVRVRARRDLSELPALHSQDADDGAVGYAPRPNYEPPAPAWKQMEAFRDHCRPTPRSDSQLLSAQPFS